MFFSDLIFGDRSLSISTILRGILSIPMVVPQNLFKPVQYLIDRMININVKTLWSIVERIQNDLANSFQTFLKESLTALMRIFNMNADLVAGFIRGIRSKMNFIY